MCNKYVDTPPLVLPESFTYVTRAKFVGVLMERTKMMAALFIRRKIRNNDYVKNSTIDILLTLIGITDYYHEPPFFMEFYSENLERVHIQRVIFN